MTPQHTLFQNRHIGINKADKKAMLKQIGVSSLNQLINETIPDSIRSNKVLNIPKAMSEAEYLQHNWELGSQNQVFRTYIGNGYYGTITPSPILRNVFENPGWYTQYTPYQAEIAQGRLEALLNFQTTVSDLTGLPVANASLLDEGSAAAEAMIMFFNAINKRKVNRPRFLVSENCFPHVIEVVKTRAIPLGIIVEVGNHNNFDFKDDVFGCLLSYPAQFGMVEDLEIVSQKAHENNCLVATTADLLSLTLLKPPAEWGADCVVGSTQRFGVPLGYGGPHAAYFATTEKYKRQLPGRIIGISQDRLGNTALRMALQTREQHIRREKATSNICTAQALLAIMAGMYAVYHGADGLKAIANQIHEQAKTLNIALDKLGYYQTNAYFFDTLHIQLSESQVKKIGKLALAKQINFRYVSTNISISIDECTRLEDLEDIIEIFAEAADKKAFKLSELSTSKSINIPENLVRKSAYLQHPVFSQYHTETELMRYIKRLENKDLSLVHSMIPLGSCTMKLNAATELLPLSWPEWAYLHPFAPTKQTQGYQQMFESLENYLAEITGFAACSLQPNSGAQGEYTGLMVIRAFHIANGDAHRNVVIIPSSAHGTNPASAVMSGMKVVVVGCDKYGNINMDELKEQAETHAENLSALMITYPSTHGVFEPKVKEMCQVIHDNGGRVYMDGANMNAQVGLTSPGIIGADVCHLNLHKTFAIPHGGGGPGMGPICCTDELKPFLPSHGFINSITPNKKRKNIGAVASAPWGSASILLISYAYIRMLGAKGLLASTEAAILNANYIKSRIESHYEILYSGVTGRIAHELIIDCRPFKAVGIEVEDIAKRLIDYGFHAPTMSWPVPGTMMIEPTESESKEELDRFCDALISIKKEIEAIEKGEMDAVDNILKNAPHPINEITADDWHYAYPRSQAAYPLPWVKERKFWATVARVDNAFGDRNLVCTCPPVEAYK